jgi:hypothetical protein
VLSQRLVGFCLCYRNLIVAEGQALLKGITFANDLLSCMLIVELDYSNVITAINEFQPQQSYLGAIAEDRGSFFFQISII